MKAIWMLLGASALLIVAGGTIGYSSHVVAGAALGLVSLLIMLGAYFRLERRR